MDHEREMIPAGEPGDPRNAAERAKAFFLRVVKEEFRTAKVQYNLNEEFAKTRKNRNLFVVAVVLLTCAGFIGAAAFFSVNYEKKNNTVQINRSEFDDINLRDLLDKAKKLEADLGFAKLQIQTLSAQRDAELDRLAGQRSDRAMLALSRSVAEDGQATGTEAAGPPADGREAAIRARYDIRLRALAAQTASIQAELDAFDQSKLELARQQGVVLNNERHLFDKERDRVQAELEGQVKSVKADYEDRLRQRNAFVRELADSYRRTLTAELQKLKERYNPTWDDERAVDLLSAPVDQARLGQYQVASGKKAVAAGAIGQASLDGLNQELQEYRWLLDRLDQVGYGGSVPDALSQLRYRALAIADGAAKPYDDFAKAMDLKNASLAEKDNQLAQLKGDAGEAKAALAGLAKLAAQLMKGGSADLLVAAAQGDSLTAVARPGADVRAGQKYYAAKGGAEVYGLYEVAQVGDTVKLRALPAPEGKAQNAKDPNQPVFVGQDPQPYDLLVRQDKWSPKAKR